MIICFSRGGNERTDNADAHRKTNRADFLRAVSHGDNLAQQAPAPTARL